MIALMVGDDCDRREGWSPKINVGEPVTVSPDRYTQILDFTFLVREVASISVAHPILSELAPAADFRCRLEQVVMLVANSLQGQR